MGCLFSHVEFYPEIPLHITLRWKKIMFKASVMDLDLCVCVFKAFDKVSMFLYREFCSLKSTHNTVWFLLVWNKLKTLKLENEVKWLLKTDLGNLTYQAKILFKWKYWLPDVPVSEGGRFWLYYVPGTVLSVREVSSLLSRLLVFCLWLFLFLFLFFYDSVWILGWEGWTRWLLRSLLNLWFFFPVNDI